MVPLHLSIVEHANILLAILTYVRIVQEVIIL